MSFIRRKFIHGNWYLYKVHSVRVGNTVVQVVDEYLGPEEPKDLEYRQIEHFKERRRLAELDSL